MTFQQASERAEIPLHPRETTPISDVDCDNPAERNEQIEWVDNIILASAANAFITTLHTYVQWLRRSDMPSGHGKTNKECYELVHRGVNGWISINDCHNLAAILPYIGPFTIEGVAVLKRLPTYSTLTIKHTTLSTILGQCCWI